MKMTKTIICACAVAAGFAGGVAVGRWAWPGGDVGGAAKVEEDVAVEADGSSTAEGGGGAREDEEESEGVTAAAESNEEFVEAVPAESVKDDDGDGEATVEEVRDEEDGLTDEERAEKFKRENPEEWERIQKRRQAMLDAQRKAQAKRQSFLDTINDEFLTAEQKKTHAAYAEALAAREAARERIRAAVAEGRDPDMEDYRTVNRSERTLHAHAAVERRTLLEAAARSVGLTGDDVGAFVDVLDQIDDAAPASHSGLK